MENRSRALEESFAAALSHLPDLRIPTAVLVVIAVILWINAALRRPDVAVETGRLWPLLTRNARNTFNTATLRTRRRPFRQRRRRQRIAMNHTTQTPASQSGGLTIRWGRTAIALVGALGLVTFLVAGVASAFGASLVALAGWSLVATVLSVVLLRTLAVRDRKRRVAARVEQAFQEAMNPDVSAESVTPHGPASSSLSDDTPANSKNAAGTTKPAAPVFDHQHRTPATTTDHAVDTTGSTGQGSENTPKTAPEADTVHHSGSDHQGVSGAGAAEQPVLPKVPRPTYLDAEEIDRPSPEPLAEEVDPVPSPGTLLKDGVSAEYAAQVAATANRRLDLDKVLERRRAI